MSKLNDLAAIRVFVAVADDGSFSRAAERSGQTRSAVGKAIARLEEQLGTRLLHRSTRRLGLTVEGQAFYERCSQILAELDEAEALIRQDHAEPSGTLRMTVPDAVGRTCILPVLHRYLLAWPNLKAEVSFTDRVVDLLNDGYDLAVRIGNVPSDGSCITRVIARSKAIVCAAPVYLDASAPLLSHHDLPSHRRLAFGSHGRPFGWHLHDASGVARLIDSEPHLTFDSAAALREAACLGQGVAYMPDFIIGEDLAAGRLAPVLPQYTTETYPISAVYPTRRHVSLKVRLFLDMLASGLRIPAFS